MPNKFHDTYVGHNVHAITANPDDVATGYATIAARDADTTFNADATNINKVVRVASPLSFYVLASVGPAVFVELTNVENDTFIEHSDTPAAYASFVGRSVQVNAGETALEFGQALRPADQVVFAGLTLSDAAPLTIGTSKPFADAAGVLTLQNVDAIDATTEATIEAAIDTLGAITAESLVVTGDLTVNGTTTTINSTTLTVDDKNIELGSVATPTDVTADGGGITLKGDTDKTIVWVNATDAWTFNQDVEITGQIKITGGSPAAGKVLTSFDAFGLATWSLPSGGGWTDSGTNVFLTTIIDKVGIGESGPATKLHVADGGVSGASPFAGTIITLESPGATFLSILSPDANSRGILFGEPASNVAGGILYNTPTTPDGFEFRTNGGVPRVAIDAAGKVILEDQIQIKGGVPALSKVLTSDAAGLATWEDPSGLTVGQDSFTSTNARFFGELGVPGSQPGWVDTVTSPATIDTVTRNVFGTVKQVVRHNDDGAGLTNSIFALSASDWVDTNANGASFSGREQLDTDDGFNGFFGGFQANAAENPLATGDRRYGITFNNDGGNLRVTEPDTGGTTVTFDGTAGNPQINFDDFFDWECKIPAGLGAAQFFVNDLLTTFAPTFITNTGGLGTRVLIGSGSSGGVDRIVYHDNFGVTIYKESSIKILAAADLALDRIEVFVPNGTVDYTITLPTGITRKQGASIVVFTEDVGTITFNSQDGKSLFNGLTTLVLSIDKQQILTLTNLVDNDNIYSVETVEDTLQFEHSGVVSVELDSLTIVDPGPTTPIIRAKDIRVVNVRKRFDKTIPKILRMQPPQTDFAVPVGVNFIYATDQGRFRFGSDAPTADAVTKETLIGKVVNPAGTITSLVFTPVTTPGTVIQKTELIEAGGRKLTRDGGTITGGGAVDKTVQNVGKAFHEQLGRAVFSDPDASDRPFIPAIGIIGSVGSNSVLSTAHKLADGSLSIDTFQVNATLPEIDTANFNSGGTLTALLSNKWVALHVIAFAQSNVFVFYYGLVEYGNQQAARDGFASEDFEVFSGSLDGSHIGTLLCEANTTTEPAAFSANTIEFIARNGRRS